MRAPAVLDREAADLFGPVQPFGVRRTSIGQRGRSRTPSVARGGLDPADLVQRLVERRREALVHRKRLLAVEAAGDEERPVPVALEERDELCSGMRASTVGFAIL